VEQDQGNGAFKSRAAFQVRWPATATFDDANQKETMKTSSNKSNQPKEHRKALNWIRNSPRHTAESSFVSKPVTQQEVARWCGHSKAILRPHYARLLFPILNPK
jgi:hypothetical protein